MTSARLKQRVDIGGEQTWVTGTSIAALLQAAVEKASAASCASSVRFAEYAERWFETYKKPKLKKTTLTGYRNILDVHLLKAFGDKPISSIDVPDVQRLFSSRSHLSKSTHHLMRVVLSQIFDSAIEDGIMSFNPAKSKRLFLSAKEKKKEALSHEQFVSVAKGLDKLSEKDRVLLALLLFTGMRRGEVCGLQRKDVDFERSVIHVRQNATFIGNKTSIGTPKTESSNRDIAISSDLTLVLTSVTDMEPNAYVVSRSARPMTESAFDRAWERIGKTISLYGATPHTFRHTYLTELAAAGVDAKTIQAIAGHSDIRITMNRYVHARQDNIQNAAAAITQVLSAAM